MTIQEIYAKVAAPEYDFLQKDKNLGDKIILLALGGSHAYGTNKRDERSGYPWLRT